MFHVTAVIMHKSQRAEKASGLEKIVVKTRWCNNKKIYISQPSFPAHESDCDSLPHEQESTVGSSVWSSFSYKSTAIFPRTRERPVTASLMHKNQRSEAASGHLFHIKINGRLSPHTRATCDSLPHAQESTVGSGVSGFIYTGMTTLSPHPRATVHVPCDSYPRARESNGR